jgi:hypothetical protein
MRLRSWISSVLLPGSDSRRLIAAAARATPSPIRKFAANQPPRMRASESAPDGSGLISHYGRAAMANMASTRIPMI